MKELGFTSWRKFSKSNWTPDGVVQVTMITSSRCSVCPSATAAFVRRPDSDGTAEPCGRSTRLSGLPPPMALLSTAAALLIGLPSPLLCCRRRIPLADASGLPSVALFFDKTSEIPIYFGHASSTGGLRPHRRTPLACSDLPMLSKS